MKISTLIGRLSVSRKLLLIYLLDLTAVIFITAILIEEKFINIDFARKELSGNAYIVLGRKPHFSNKNRPLFRYEDFPKLAVFSEFVGI